MVGSVPKEIFYFCSHPEKTEQWYRRHFPKLNALQKANAICGEATPISLNSAKAAKRAFELVPQAKLIIILREPAARAVSHYYHQVRAGVESRSIDEVFSPTNIARWEQGDCPDLPRRFYFKWSDYATGIQRWLDYFPKEQMLILEAESMFEDTQSRVDLTCRFLGLSRVELPRLSAFNSGQVKAAKPKAFQCLKASFSKHNECLQRLGYSMRWN